MQTTVVLSNVRKCSHNWGNLEFLVVCKAASYCSSFYKFVYQLSECATNARSNRKRCTMRPPEGVQASRIPRRHNPRLRSDIWRTERKTRARRLRARSINGELCSGAIKSTIVLTCRDRPQPPARLRTFSGRSGDGPTPSEPGARSDHRFEVVIRCLSLLVGCAVALLFSKCL